MDASSDYSGAPSNGSGSIDIASQTESNDLTSPNRLRGLAEDRGALGNMFSVIRSTSRTVNDSIDVEIERKVSQAAGRLGKDIQQIIVAAKAGGGQSTTRPNEERKSGTDFENDAWKTKLLHILGGTDIDVEQRDNPYASSDIDILLQNATCDKFILRCIENELPPNLIHCLRLLRVLELQAAHSYARLHRNVKSATKNTNSVSRSATEKVMQLLILLCKDISVGEQLRPHLFGLLALPGASYPPNGMHIARAATEIVVAFSRSCLNPSLAMFLHDRKVIMNMTDDVKELCGLIEASNLTSGSLCLYGESAELAGLWVVGLRAIVHLVHASCSQRCADILRDFYDAGGYELLTFAIWNSRSNNVKKLLELVATLTYCKIETGLSRGEHDNSSSNFFNDFNKPPLIEKGSGDYGLATNPGAFQLIEDLMARSVPFLKKYNDFYKSKVTLQGSSIKDLALTSLDISTELHVLSKMKDENEIEVSRCNELASELLISTLQLYSDHPRNYSIIEEKYHVLALYLLSFTSFSDISMKVLILKMLEYICTGLTDINPRIPLQITCEMLLAMSKYHLRLSVDEESIKSHNELLSKFSFDSSMLLEALEKLALMGTSVRDVLIAIGIFDEHFDEFSSTIMNSLSQDQQHNIRRLNAPPVRTAFDEPFMNICRLLNISLHLSGCNSNNTLESRKLQLLEGSLTLTGQSRDLNLLINAGVCEMGAMAAETALATLGTKMSYYTSTSQLQIDMLFLLQLSIHFSELTMRTPSSSDAQINAHLFISRQIMILKTLSSVLTINHDAIHSFRIGMGFDIILRALVSLSSTSNGSQYASEPDEDDNPVLQLIKQAFDLLSVALSLKEYLTEGFSSGDYIGQSYDHQTYFTKLADSILATGMLSFCTSGEFIIKCALQVIEPSLLLVKSAETVDEKNRHVEAAFNGRLRNPVAISLVLGIAVRMTADINRSCDAIDTIYNLCIAENSPSCGQVATSGLCRELIESTTFLNVLQKPDHPLYSSMRRLFMKISSMRMNYIEFIWLNRRMIWPLFSSEGGRLSKLDLLTDSNSEFDKIDQKLKIVMENISELADEGTRSAAMKLGGSSLSSIATEIQKGRLEECLQKFAKEGGVNYIQLNTVESSSHSTLSAQSLGGNIASADNLWVATSNNGFSYSLWIRVPQQQLSDGIMFLFDIASAPDDDSYRLSRTHYEYLSFFFDAKKESFQIITSSSPKPISFPCTPLASGWHHILFIYQPAKRSMLSRKVQIGLVIDGQSVDMDIKIDPVMLPSKSRIYIGVPNPVLIISGIVSGPLLNWDMGSFTLYSISLSVRDATAIYLFGPNFAGNFWGDRPQRLSLSACATAAFAYFAIANKTGCILGALEQCGIPDFESSSHVSMENRFHGAYYEDSLSTMGLLFQVNPDAVMAAFRLSSYRTIEPYERCLYNLARINLSESVTTDATAFGDISVTIPQSFADNVRWAGGPSIFFHYVFSSASIEQLILSLRLIRSSLFCHIPNIDYMQSCGGYRVLAYLLKEKNMTDPRIIDECFGIATNTVLSKSNEHFIEKNSDQMVLIDLEAMKTILLNQHVWDLQSGPVVSLHLNSRLSLLIAPGAMNSPFNARRLHQIGIVPFILDLMLEAAKMYNMGYLGAEEMKKTDLRNQPFLNALSAFKNGWYVAPPSSTVVSAGGDPGNPLLFSCKNLLRRVLTYMLTPLDLENMAASAIYTLSIDNTLIGVDATSDDVGMDSKLLNGSVTRIYLLRIMEELIIERIDVKVGLENAENNRSEQTRAFLSAFSGILRPIWFMSLLEKSRDEASTSAVFRLLVLMIQTSPSFIEVFIQEDGFKTLILTVPKLSTSPSIILNLLGLLLHAPIWHLPCFATLQSTQLRDVFESEWDDVDLVKNETSVAGLTFPIAQGSFALLLDCIVRNIRLSELDDKLGKTAATTNDAVLSVIEVCIKRSTHFREFSRTLGSFEPLTNAICASIGAKRRREATVERKRTDTEPSLSLNVDSKAEKMHGLLGSESEMRLVSIMRMIVSELITSKPSAASMMHVLFRSYPPHASVDEIEGFHSVLIECCVLAVQECLLNPNTLVFSNMAGLCSVLLERLRSGFFGRYDVLECVSVSTLVLNRLLSLVTKTVGAASNESNSLVADTLHIVRLICLTALQRYRYSTIIELDMIPLQQKLSNIIISNLKNMLTTLPASVPNTPKKQPSESSAYQLWQSASIIRSRTSIVRSSYPDINAVEDPERSFILVVLAEENFLLLQKTKEIREIALPVILMLLRERRSLMAELLKKDFRKGENRLETIDLINRGGFGALLALIDSPVSASDNSSSKLLNDAFFDWIDRNQSQVTPIFDSIRTEAYARLPVFESNIVQTADMAIENEQRMILDLQSHTDEENVIVKRGERTEYVQKIHETCTEYLSVWKRCGFSDVICGEFLWEKYLLRQKVDFSFESSDLVQTNKSKLDDAHLSESLQTTRLTLDLSEGFERQRRRLLPNHKFNVLYNIMDKESLPDIMLLECKETSNTANLDDKEETYHPSNDSVDHVLQAAAAILKVAKVHKRPEGDFESDSDFEINDGGDQAIIQSLALNQGSTVESSTDPTDLLQSDNAVAEKPEFVKLEADFNDDDGNHLDGNEIIASSLDLVMGFLIEGDKPEKVLNVKRCIGLEVRKAILLWCSRAIYIIDGFETIQGEGILGRINRVEQYKTTFNISLRERTLDEGSSEVTNDANANSAFEKVHENANGKKKMKKLEQAIYRHRSQRISFDDIHCIYRRRYQLRQNALEFYDIHKTATLVAFDNQAKREEVLMSTLNARLPNSIFNSGIFGSTLTLSYNKFMNNYRAKVTNDWVSGKMSNFDFLMHLNTFAGRSYNDLTQYPIFPWVLADYESANIDLNDPSIYRDLSKPMGAIGESRAKQFKDRYDALEMHYLDQDEHEQPPPFHYGTHYSCAAYVVNYLIRLEPFTRLALTLQGGKFDLADRLFQSVAASWRSASRDNLQDVRELIPEFFYLPDFLLNKNSFNYGVTQHGKIVHHVTLPPWARGDPARFIRMQRKALESDFVSRNLHKWIDLVFGYKQLGREAVEALNTFVHVTYEGAVDLDTIEDQVVRESTLAQIHNFGQTPSRLEKSPFPPRNVPSILKERTIDLSALAHLSHLTPPYCITGAPHKVYMKTASWDSCKLGMSGQEDVGVGDVFMTKGPIIGVGMNCIFVNSSTYIRYDGRNNGISFHVATASTRYREVDKILSIIDDMHSSPVSMAKISSDAHFLITTCSDSTVRVWRVKTNSRTFERSYTLRLQGTLTGHEGVKITCMDICSIFGTIVTGDTRGVIHLWNLRTLSFLRRLSTDENRSPAKMTEPAISVSLNRKNGNIVTLVGSTLKVFDINGIPLATLPPDFKFPMNNMPTCAVSTNCQEWMDGIVTITGHMNGDVRMWSIDYERGLLVFRHVIPDKVHENSITCLRCLDNQKHLLIGDSSGRISMATTMQLDSLSLSELAVVAEEIRMLS